MDWNWACEQLLKGKNVRCKSWNKNAFLHCGSSNKFVYGNSIYGNSPYELEVSSLQATDWELYQEPKKWSEEQVEWADAMLVFGGTHLACDKDGDVCMYSHKPYKAKQGWCVTEGNCYNIICGNELSEIFGNDVKWKDEEPTSLRDIVNSQKGEN